MPASLRSWPHALAVLTFPLVALTLADHARADAQVPSSPLQLRVLARQGELFSVEVKNPTDAPLLFDELGLYFVPNEKHSAPQRLGVVSDEVVTVAAHGAITVNLPTYCLDEHRAGPVGTTTYHLAHERLPIDLAYELVSAVTHDDAGDTQRAVWRARSQLPTALEAD